MKIMHLKIIPEKYFLLHDLRYNLVKNLKIRNDLEKVTINKSKTI